MNRGDDPERFTSAEHDALQAAMLDGLREQRRANERRSRNHALLTIAIVGGVSVLTTLAVLLFTSLHGGLRW